MSIIAKCLSQAHFASTTDNTEYTAPVSTRTIVDKFTATNTDSATQTLTVNIVGTGSSLGASNVIATLSLAAGATVDLTQIQNQILNAGDLVSCKASVGNKIVIRMSGREIQ